MELIKVEKGIAILDAETASTVAQIERQMKYLKEQEEALKKVILAEMEAKNIIKIDTPDMTVSYIAQTDRETFDSKKFRNDDPDTYDKYVRMSPVKASIRIKVKDNG